MDDSRFWILALENIKEGIQGERYTMAMEKLDYLIDMVKDRNKEKEAHNG